MNQGKRRNLTELAAELQSLSGPDFLRLLEATLHQTWEDGWSARDEPHAGARRNPYNILTRVPIEFLKPAMDLANARAEFLEQNLNEHLFPGMFPKRCPGCGSSERMEVSAINVPPRPCAHPWHHESGKP